MPRSAGKLYVRRRHAESRGRLRCQCGTDRGQSCLLDLATRFRLAQSPFNAVSDVALHREALGYG